MKIMKQDPSYISDLESSDSENDNDQEGNGVVDTTNRVLDLVGVDVVLMSEDCESDDGISLSDDSSNYMIMRELETRLEALDSSPYGAMAELDDDSSSDAEDSLYLARARGLPQARRARRRRMMDDDSFANDSMRVAKMKMARQRNSREQRDTLPAIIVQFLSPSSGSSGVDVKKIEQTAGMVASPDLDTMQPRQVSNSAA